MITPEILGTQQLVGNRVVDREIADATPDQRAVAIRSTAQLVVKGDGVCAHRGVGNNPGLRMAAAGSDRGESPYETVHREPVQPFPHPAHATPLGC